MRYEVTDHAVLFPTGVATVSTAVTVAPAVMVLTMLTRPGGAWPGAVDHQLTDQTVLLTMVMDVGLDEDIVLLVTRYVSLVTRHVDT